MRIGHGYDAHRFAEGRALILGGVHVPHERGLDGHSDADVLTHAVMDALLGAMGAGDIGALFPDTDDSYKGIRSVTLLEKIRGIMEDRGYSVINVDATIIAQQPKLAPFIGGMCANIAAALGTAVENISVKATTEERMGFTGRLEGMAAHAVCLIEKM